MGAGAGTQPATGILLMAAGLSRRMGEGPPKPLRLHAGRPLLLHALEAVRCSGLPFLVVLGHEADAVEALLPPLTPVVRATDHALGLAHSLRAGLAAAPADWGAVLVHLADMPDVKPETLQSLARTLSKGGSAVVPVFGGQRGNPVGFARSIWPALMTLEGDEGARRILGTFSPQPVEVDDPGILRDIDTPDALG